MTSLSLRPLIGSPIPDARQVAAKSSGSPRIWMVVACLLLSISGGVRFWREWQFRNLRAASAVCPFRLEDLPKSLGSWRFVAATQLDEEVARIAGSSAHIVWEYLDEKGGERVSALVLYGPATEVFGH